MCRSFSFYLLFFTHKTPFVRSPVRQQTCRTHDATAREGERLQRISRWSPLRALNLFYTPFRSLPLEGDMFNSPIPCLSHYLYRSAFTAAFLNKQCIAFAYYCIPFFYTCSLMTYCIRTLWYGQIHQGLKYPKIWCDKSEHFHKCGTPNL